MRAKCSGCQFSSNRPLPPRFLDLFQRAALRFGNQEEHEEERRRRTGRVEPEGVRGIQVLFKTGNVSETVRQADQIIIVEIDMARPRSFAGKISEQSIQGIGPMAIANAAV